MAFLVHQVDNCHVKIGHKSPLPTLWPNSGRSAAGLPNPQAHASLHRLGNWSLQGPLQTGHFFPTRRSTRSPASPACSVSARRTQLTPSCGATSPTTPNYPTSIRRQAHLQRTTRCASYSPDTMSHIAGSSSVNGNGVTSVTRKPKVPQVLQILRNVRSYLTLTLWVLYVSSRNLHALPITFHTKLNQLITNHHNRFTASYYLLTSPKYSPSSSFPSLVNM